MHSRVWLDVLEAQKMFILVPSLINASSLPPFNAAHSSTGSLRHTLRLYITYEASMQLESVMDVKILHLIVTYHDLRGIQVTRS